MRQQLTIMHGLSAGVWGGACLGVARHDPYVLAAAAIGAVLVVGQVLLMLVVSRATVTPAPLSSSDRLPRRAAALTTPPPPVGEPTPAAKGWPWGKRSDVTP